MNRRLIVWMIILVSIILYITALHLEISERQNKIISQAEIIKQEQKKVLEAKKPSIIEDYGSMADIATKESRSLLQEIDTKTQEYEHMVLVKRCALDQIQNVTEWEKVTRNYCEDSENLEQYRAK